MIPPRNHRPPRLALVGLALALCAGSARAFVLPNGSTNADAVRWQTTASGPTGSAGDPVTLTWSLVPDGTLTRDLQTPSSRSPSDLIATFDAEFGAGPGGSDYTLRPWFPFLQQSFDRWEELSGVDYVYEPNDDGATHGTTLGGQLGVRGDVRVSGVGIDGDLNALAYNFFPSDGGDLAFDTDDADNYFADTNVPGDFPNLRYTTTHELGHGLGLEHTTSSSAAFLMEANPNPGIDGPQHDDLRGAHFLYGDALEKTNGGQGNDTSATAFDLGALAFGAPLSIGTGGDGVTIDPAETDFVSIDRANDVDFFAFTITEPTTLDVVLTPRGAQYDQTGQQFDTTETSDLSLTLIDENGVSTLATATPQPAGVAESVLGLQINDPGEYYVRVGGAGAVVQLYQVDLVAQPELLGDYNADGVVDSADFSVYRETVGSGVVPYTGADGDGDGVVGPGDYAVWAARLGDSLGGQAAVPEPDSLVLFLASAWCWRARPGRPF